MIEKIERREREREGEKERERERRKKKVRKEINNHILHIFNFLFFIK